MKPNSDQSGKFFDVSNFVCGFACGVPSVNNGGPQAARTRLVFTGSFQKPPFGGFLLYFTDVAFLWSCTVCRLGVTWSCWREATLNQARDPADLIRCR